MPTSIKNLTPRQAWEPLPSSQWGDAEAAHLLRRASFSAHTNQLQEVSKHGLQATVASWFMKPRLMLEEDEIGQMSESDQKMVAAIRQQEDDESKRELRRKLRKTRSMAYQDFGVRWLQFAQQPEHSPQEKYVLFLQNIFVVARSSVPQIDELYDHQALLRRHGLGSYPELAKAVSRSPAMIRYLNLNRSSKRAPNENFARELLELFTLGEGNYTEQDIKQAARAFTGYRTTGKGFKIVPKYHDEGSKTVFGKSGNFDGDDVIDLVYEQPAAETFVPRELIHNYLSEQPLPEPFVRELGRFWKTHDYNMSDLLRRFFTSRIFYAPEYRMNLIKSPVQFYIGLYQDAELDIPPLSSRTLSPLRSMGQEFYNPPNVRGWVGGRHWINATTLNARRQLTRSLFWKINEEKLNADEKRDMEAAREQGYERFVIDDKIIRELNKNAPHEIVNLLCERFLPEPPSPAYQAKLEAYLTSEKKNRQRRIREVLQTLMQSPQYQLC